MMVTEPRTAGAGQASAAGREAAGRKAAGREAAAREADGRAAAGREAAAPEAGVAEAVTVPEAVAAAVRAVPDPEIPVLTIEDLGILREVTIEELAEQDESVSGRGLRARVVITPTYSGCPAMDTITADVHRAAKAAGAAEVEVALVFSPAWSTDWMSEAGRAKLSAYGIAPPTGRAAAGPIGLQLAVKCPRCHSLNTAELARFGSTACKALYRCADCLEPFDYFKVH